MLQPQIIGAEPMPCYRLLLRYAPNEVRLFDVSPYIKGDWYGKLIDVQYFNTVRVTRSTVEWPEGQDIAPHELYEMSEPVT